MPDYDTVSLDDPPRPGMVLAPGTVEPETAVPIMDPYARAVGFTQRFNKDKHGPLGKHRLRI